MGTWGYRVLHNDYVLDELYDYFNKEYDYDVELFVHHLFTFSPKQNSGHRKLLGVAIVDASINGCDRNLLGLDYGTLDKYTSFFANVLPLHPLYNLVPDALIAIDECIADGVDGWAQDCQEPRMQLYHTYMRRLEEVE